MTRPSTIDAIHAKLAVLDDAQLLTVRDLLDDMTSSAPELRDLSPRELELLARARRDFADGRVRTASESEAYVTAEVERRLSAHRST